MNSYSPSISAPPVDPPEQASTGRCDMCGEDLGKLAFDVRQGRLWSDGSKVMCVSCLRNHIHGYINDVQDADVLDLLQSVDEVRMCSGCDRFSCWCNS